MKLPSYRLGLAALASLLLLIMTACGGSQPQDEDILEPGVTFQSEAAAQDADVRQLASEAGLSAEAVREAIEFQDAFSAYADDLLSRYPGQVSALWLEPAPATRGHVRFVNAVPADLSAGLSAQGVLSGNVTLTGNGEISLEEHVRRAELAAEALVDLGYENYVTFFDPSSQVIKAQIQVPESAARPDSFVLANALQTRLQAARSEDGGLSLQGAAATLDVNDLDIDVQVSEGPFAALDHSRGGNFLRDDGVRECTSGWSVKGPNGDGIITAAHCNGLNQFEQSPSIIYPMSWKKQVWGLGGDVEYHTTTHVELAEFYANASKRRDVKATKATGSMVGGSVCLYGRFSNVRTCSHHVTAIGVTLNFSGRIVSNLAITNTTSSVPGDSGGGWSFGTTAWGVNTGRILTTPPQGIFTPVRQAEAVLGVTVKKK